MRPPEVFEGSRVMLRPLGRADADAIFHGYASLEAPTRHMNFKRHDSIDQSLQFADRCQNCWLDGSAFPWAIVQRQTGQFLGCIEVRPDPPKADIGYILCEQFWGHGFATEAARIVVDWIFNQPSIFRVWATCSPDNISSARVLEKSGLVFEARLEAWEARPQLMEPAGPSLVYSKIKTRSSRSPQPL